MVRIGVIGLGYWGPNLARVVAGLPDAELRVLCDLDPVRLAEAAIRFPGARVTSDTEEVFGSQDLDAVIIATPTSTHYALACRAIEHGLHVFVEKPLATTPAECADLTRRAAERGVVLFVGHVFLYTAAVARLKAILDDGELGGVRCISATRRNLGPVRSDVNALWDLATHDISIILHLLGELPVQVNCQGVAHLRPDIEDVCMLTMTFASGVMAVVHSSWMDPTKIRQMTVVGASRMAVFDDMEPVEKLRVHDKGIDLPPPLDGGAAPDYRYRSGETHSPGLEAVEPLKNQLQHFVECVATGAHPQTDGANGWEVVQVLEAADRSLRAGGAPVRLLGLERELLPIRIARLVPAVADPVPVVAQLAVAS
jgi:predicted dehydrogenase